MSKCKPLSAYLCPKPTMAVRPMKEGEDFNLGDSERALFDCIINEHTGIVGTKFEYFQNLQEGVTDPLYNEPAVRKYNGPFILKGFFTFPEDAPTSAQEGFYNSFDGQLFVPRSEFEKVGATWGPSESDIVRILKSPYWNQESVDGFDLQRGSTLNGLIPNAGMYFAVTDVRESGLLFDTTSFVGFELTIRRNTQQTPERKLTNSI